MMKSLFKDLTILRVVVYFLKFVLLPLFVLLLFMPTLLYFYPEVGTSFIFNPRSRAVNSRNPADHDLTGYNFYLRSGPTMVSIWHLLPSNNSSNMSESEMKSMLSEDNQKILIYFKGNYYDRASDEHIEVYRKFLDAGWQVVTFDYKGYGESAGDPTGNGVVEDGKTVIKWVRSKSQKNLVILWSYSLGTCIASQAMYELWIYEHFYISGLVLLSPLYSMESTVRQQTVFKLFIGWLPSFISDAITKRTITDFGLEFPTYKHIVETQTPIWQLHARDDIVVPFTETMKLLDYYKEHNRHHFKEVFFEEHYNYGHYIANRHEHIISNFTTFIQSEVVPNIGPDLQFCDNCSYFTYPI